MVTHPENLASKLLKLEQQLMAYQKLHEDEMSELWRVLNTCKREITAQGKLQADDQTIPEGKESASQV
jgi:hypothetical protein